MLETSARLLRLLSLFQAQRYWSGAALSERLEVTARTLRRDVDRLRSLGYPVNSTAGAGAGQIGTGAAGAFAAARGGLAWLHRAAVESGSDGGCGDALRDCRGLPRF